MCFNSGMTNNEIKDRGYKVRRQMQVVAGKPEGYDVSGSWSAVVLQANKQLERLGFEGGEQVTLQHTSNAGFNGIVV